MNGKGGIGLPNCLDTSSNVLFFLAGAPGLSFLAGGPQSSAFSPL